MSTPNIPNITPSITLTRDDAVNLLFSSIAMEELGLAHILNAEGEKIQYALGTLPGLSGPPATVAQLLQLGNNVRSMLNTTSKHEMMLDSVLSTASNLKIVIGATGPTGTTGAAGGVLSINGQTGTIVLDPEDIGALPLTQELSTSNLDSFTEAGVYSSADPNGGDPDNGPPLVAHPPVWTLYVSKVGEYVQQLYISNPVLYYRSSQDAGANWTPWQEIGQQGFTGPKALLAQALRV